MLSREISLDSLPAKQARVPSRLGRPVLIAMILGLLAAASILLLVYLEHRALNYRIDAVEVWSDYQVKIVKATIEEDPNLKAQYIEEQDLLRQHAQVLKEKGSDAKVAVTISACAALLLLLGAATAVVALVSNSIHAEEQKDEQAVVQPVA